MYVFLFQFICKEVIVEEVAEPKKGGGQHKKENKSDVKSELSDVESLNRRQSSPVIADALTNGEFLSI